MVEKDLARSQLPADEIGKSTGFKRRYYRGWNPFWEDMKFMINHREMIKEAMRSDLITHAFRERLMLAVTEINQCRYCRTFHVGQARQAGISQEEINIYLLGTIPGTIPEDQKLAVCFAQHWAENDGQPDPEFQTQIIQTYGEKGYQDITMVLQMIRMGNLLGNTLDYFLYRLSFGKLGA